MQTAPASRLSEAENRLLDFSVIPDRDLAHEVCEVSRSLTRFFEQLARIPPDSSRRELLNNIARLEAGFDRRHSSTVNAALV